MWSHVMFCICWSAVQLITCIQHPPNHFKKCTREMQIVILHMESRLWKSSQTLTIIWQLRLFRLSSLVTLFSRHKFGFIWQTSLTSAVSLAKALAKSAKFHQQVRFDPRLSNSTFHAIQVFKPWSNHRSLSLAPYFGSMPHLSHSTEWTHRSTSWRCACINSLNSPVFIFRTFRSILEAMKALRPWPVLNNVREKRLLHQL